MEMENTTDENDNNTKGNSRWRVDGQVDMAPPSTRQSKRIRLHANVESENECLSAPLEICIKRRRQRNQTKIQTEPTPLDAPVGFTYIANWITSSLENAMLEYFHYRLKVPATTDDNIHRTPRHLKIQKGSRSKETTVAHPRRVSERLIFPVQLTENNEAIGKRLGFSPYTLRDSQCMLVMHCAKGADTPIRISEGRYGRNTRFIVEEMPSFLTDLAQEIRNQFPGQFKPPSLDYAQVNVIAMDNMEQRQEQQYLQQQKSPQKDNENSDAEKGFMKYVGSRHKTVILDYHRDHDELEDIAVVSLLGNCTLRLRKGGREYSQIVHPRSLYLLRGPARLIWEHAVDDVCGERISIVFRSKCKGL